ncbi:Auxin-responsive protein IAA29 [Linum grandiflorum]
MELELALSLPATSELNGTAVNPFDKWPDSYCFENKPNKYYEDHDTNHSSTSTPHGDDDETSSPDAIATLPLFVWSGRKPDYDGNTSKGCRSRFVKVKMAGEAIIRKIDLNRYDSYHSLTRSILRMFSKYGTSQQDIDEDCGVAGSYTLSYQDESGDWLLAGQVPWQLSIN